MSYGIFASYYDLLTDNVEYEAYAKRIDELVSRFGGKKGALVDLACGTATLDFELEKLGYTVTGCDLSCDMLSFAAQKKYSQNSDIMLINQDMTCLELPFKPDVFVCTLDALNHLEGLIFVEFTLQRVAKYLKKDGLFIFDMNTVYKHKEVLADNAFVYDTDEGYVVWQNEYNDMDRSVLITLDFFVPDEEENYQRYSESFKETAYDVESIKRIIENSGLELKAMYDGLSNNAPDDKTERILYVCGLKK